MTEYKLTQEEYEKILAWIKLQEEINENLNNRIMKLEGLK